MTRLSYEYTNKAGEVTMFSSYDAVVREVMHNGGSYKPVYTRIEERAILVPKRKRIKLWFGSIFA